MSLTATVLGVIGNITSMALFLSPTPTFWKIFKARNTGDFSAVPYVFTLLNCLLWILYGTPMVKNLVLVISINAAGLVLEIAYIILYLIYAEQHYKIRVGAMLSMVLAFFVVITAITLGGVPKAHRDTVVGSVCVVVGTLMSAAPLAVLKTVVKTRSVEYMPFLLSLFVLLNGAIWTAYGSVQADTFIIVPNALGTLLGITQLALYFWFCGESTKPRDTDNYHGHSDVVHNFDLENATKLRKDVSKSSTPNNQQSRHGSSPAGF